MLLYALKPVMMTDVQRRDLILSVDQPFSYVQKRVIQLRQALAVAKWVQGTFFSTVFHSTAMIDPHLIKCFINRSLLKRRERNLVYEFNRSNVQLELQGHSHLDYVISCYLHNFRAHQSSHYHVGDNNGGGSGIRGSRSDEHGDEHAPNVYLMDQQLVHVKSLMTHPDTLRLYAQSIGIDDDLLFHFQEFPQQKSGLDVLMSIIAQTSNMIGVEASRRLLTQHMIPSLLQIIEEHPVPEIKTEHLVKQLCLTLYKQDPAVQTREYKMKFGKGHRMVYSTFVIVNQTIKGQGVANNMKESKEMALRSAFDQLQSETMSENL